MLHYTILYTICYNALYGVTSQAQADLPTPRPHKRGPLWLDVGYPSVLAVADGIHIVIRH